MAFDFEFTPFDTSKHPEFAYYLVSLLLNFSSARFMISFNEKLFSGFDV